MKNDQKIKEMIASFSGQKNIISFPKIYLAITEDINSALLLNQIIYWSDRTKRQDGYFYKSYKDWKDEIMLSQYQVKRSATKLERLGLISTQLKKANNTPIVHYKAHMGAVTDSIMKKLDNEETQQSHYQETSLSHYEETQQSSIAVDYLTVDYKQLSKEEPAYKKVEKHFITINPNQRDELIFYIGEYDEPDQIIGMCIDIMKNKGIKKWNYMTTILNEWRENKLKTLSQVKDYEDNKWNKGKKKVAAGKTDKFGLNDMTEDDL